MDKNFPCHIRSRCSFSVLCSLTHKNVSLMECAQGRFDKGTLFWFNQVDRQDVYVLCSGITVVYNYLDGGRESVYTILGKGQVMGAGDLFIQNKRLFVIQALTDIKVCRINGDSLKHLVATYPDLFLSLYFVDYNNIQAMTQYIEVISAKRVYDRVKNLLALLAGYEDDPSEVSLALTHNDLARLVCSDRVSVTRILHRLNEEGWVKLGNRNFTITVPSQYIRYDLAARFAVLDETLRNKIIQQFTPILESKKDTNDRPTQPNSNPLPSKLPYL